MPKASIVIPCYNAEQYLAETLESAMAQTVTDIEIICVDNNSTDLTPQILRSYAEADERISVYQESEPGEGPARDAGLLVSTGEWLYFLDSDDIMEPDLLEKAITTCKKHDADLVVFRTLMLNDQTKAERLCNWSFKREWISEASFCPAEFPDHILNSFQNWVHNKLFNGDFVRSHNLRMQHVHRTADLLFTCRALTEARRIALLDIPLHHYRVNNPRSAMATSDQYPLDFYQAFLALRKALEEAGTWSLYHDSFVNWAIEGFSANIRLARSLEGYKIIVDALLKDGLDALDIRDFPRERSDHLLCFDHIHTLTTESFEEGIFWEIRFFQSEIERLENEVSDCYRAIEGRDGAMQRITNSVSFKAGRALTFAPRKLRDALKKVEL